MKENCDTANVEDIEAKKMELEQKFRPIKDLINREAGLMQPIGDNNDDLEWLENSDYMSNYKGSLI